MDDSWSSPSPITLSHLELHVHTDLPLGSNSWDPVPLSGNDLETVPFFVCLPLVESLHSYLYFLQSRLSPASQSASGGTRTKTGSSVHSSACFFPPLALLPGAHSLPSFFRFTAEKPASPWGLIALGEMTSFSLGFLVWTPGKEADWPEIRPAGHRTQGADLILVQFCLNLIFLCVRLSWPGKIKNGDQDFPGGPVVKMLPSSAGGAGLMPGQWSWDPTCFTVKKPKHQSSIVINSKTSLKMVHIKKKRRLKTKFSHLQI